jgi:hypothetical protein
MYGPPVLLHITDFMQGIAKPKNSGPLDGDGRRSIYQEVRRNFLEPMMLTFDRPIPFTAFGKRNVTNVPAQSLILLNDPFVIQQADVMSSNLMGRTGLSLDERFQWIYRRALSRDPTRKELLQARTFLLKLAKRYEVEDSVILEGTFAGYTHGPHCLVSDSCVMSERVRKVWKHYCHSVFNSKEFIYLI